MLESLKNKKILLIEPPFYRLFGYKRYHYPFTLTLVGTYLEKLGNTVRIYDADRPTSSCKEYSRSESRDNYYIYEKVLMDKNHKVWKEIQDKILDFQPDIIGLTAITAKIDSANIIAKIAKDLLGKNVKVILGGPHANGMLDMYPGYNFGENYDHAITNIPGLVSLKPNKRLIIDYEKYSAKNFSSILTSSGCPNRCTFCCHSFEKGFYYRSKESVIEEIKEIQTKLGGDIIYVMDDCLFSNPKHFRDITSAMKETGMKFVAGARLMALSQEKLRLFKECGGQKIHVGVESGSQRILNAIKKNLKVEEIIKRTKWIRDLKIPYQAFLMVGFPFETLEDLKLTKKLIEKIRPNFISLNQFTPYPGTQIYKDYYMDKKIPFKDLFQLNGNVQVGLSDDIKEYINGMFDFVDDYNARNAFSV
ncbi:radical SAM protein [Candidatus Woesearchaeota archaeon]|nr:radical SAM protein [Candidatus Woesearchaeota archaeon]